MIKRNIITALCSVLFFYSCDNDNDNSIECDIDSLNIVTIDASSWDDWVYYSFELEDIVDIVNPESSLDWDIAFQRNNIRTNGGESYMGQGCGMVNQNQSWTCDLFQSTNEISNDMVCESDIEISGTGMQFNPPYEGCYNSMTHSFENCIKNPALDNWGWFDSDYYFNVTDYILFIRDANGNDIKLWLLSYYGSEGSGFIDMAYQILN